MRAALVALVMVSCGDGDARPVQIQLINRSSCLGVYNLSCMTSLNVRMFNDEQSFRSRCSALVPPFETWQDFVSNRDTTFVLEDVRARKNVRLEVRGYHNLGDENDTCENLSDRRLLLWGTSDPFDVTGTKTTTVNVYVDCRPFCDCNFINTTCEPDLERGVCAPLLRRTCRNRDCTMGFSCFDEELECRQGICEADTGEMCAECSASGDCNSGLCVHHTYNVEEYHIDEKFCADAARCPPLEGYAHACPEGMQCTRLGDGSFELLP